MIKIRLEQLSIGVKCPAATQDLELNTRNRDIAIQADYIQYGPLNVDEPGDYWKDIAEYWNTTEKAAKKSLCGNCTAFDISPRMKECMPGETSDEDGELGYCHMHKFKCHSARSCRTWAKGGPIEDDDISTDWQTKGDKKELQEKKKKTKKDRCYRIAKRKYDVFPSAYASGAIVKCRQGKIWKGIKEELIPGGLGAELTGDMEEKHKQIANMHSTSVKEIEKQLDKGTEAEMEHTSDPAYAHEIAMDHVIEDPKYYDKLIKLRLEGRKKKAGTESSKESSLRDWFKRKGAPGKKGGWVDCNTCRKGKCKPCGRKEGEKRAKYPSCRPTPAACKERGRGKTWGKKSSKGVKESTLKENLDFHLANKIPMTESVLRFGSDSYLDLIKETKTLWQLGGYDASEEEKTLFKTDIGDYELYEGYVVPLDVPMLNEEIIEGKKKNPPLNKPSLNSGSGKKWKVFVRDPKTGNVKKVTFGDKKGGLKGNWNDPEARASFAKRHKCAEKKDKTKPGYWACRAHKYFGKNVPGRFW
jgi:hypothetical protein